MIKTSNKISNLSKLWCPTFSEKNYISHSYWPSNFTLKITSDNCVMLKHLLWHLLLDSWRLNLDNQTRSDQCQCCCPVSNHVNKLWDNFNGKKSCVFKIKPIRCIILRSYSLICWHLLFVVRFIIHICSHRLTKQMLHQHSNHISTQFIRIAAKVWIWNGHFEISRHVRTPAHA